MTENPSSPKSKKDSALQEIKSDSPKPGAEKPSQEPSTKPGDEKFRLSNRDENRQAQAEGTKLSQSSSLGKVKLFVLEDSEIAQKNFLEFAKKYSFHIVGLSKTAKGLLKQVKEKNPHVMILDLVIPEEDILALIQQLKSSFPELPLIVCSSLTDDLVVSRCLKAGCFDYVFKPFKEDQLAVSIKKAVSK